MPHSKAAGLQHPIKRTAAWVCRHRGNSDRAGFWARLAAGGLALPLRPAFLDALYDRYIVPTPGNVYRDGVAGASGRIRWDNPTVRRCC